MRPSGLAVGSRVLVRNVALTGKRKLANNWLPDVYRVVKQQGGEGSPVYVIRREDGKKGDRTLHRNMFVMFGDEHYNLPTLYMFITI